MSVLPGHQGDGSGTRRRQIERQQLRQPVDIDRSLRERGPQPDAKLLRVGGNAARLFVPRRYLDVEGRGRREFENPRIVSRPRACNRGGDSDQAPNLLQHVRPGVGGVEEDGAVDGSNLLGRVGQKRREPHRVRRCWVVRRRDEPDQRRQIASRAGGAKVTLNSSGNRCRDVAGHAVGVGQVNFVVLRGFTEKCEVDIFEFKQRL